ncbi:putative capsid protein [Lake Sarah-associated circular virus-48]|uniref:putative capsid protein n=1 Tax=Lake Sarah-associated circular virus-48 TaxID=1685777 RepID=UPI000776CFAA|nr:putative capsid protein [Lake Sarah-associated circular virus-48]ALE29804.1 putative capsid protein [Lake Sarah-associated circular virus-48]
MGKRGHFNTFGGAFGSIAKRAYSSHIRQGLSNRVAGIFRGAGSSTRNGNQSRRTGRDTGSTTRYADSAMLYKRRPAPRKLRNRVRKFANRVRSVIDGEVALQVAVIPYAYNTIAGYQTPVTVKTLTNNQNSNLIPGLYSCNGTHNSSKVNGNWYDLYEIFQTYKPEGQLNDDTILEFTSATWNCVMNNISGTGVRAIVDVYECVARRDWKPSDNPYSVFSNFLPDNSQFSNTSAAFRLTSLNLGVTPFDNPTFCELWKILKVRRIKLEDGATATLQFRDPKRRKIEYQSKVSNKSSIKGVTRFWLPIVYGVPSLNGEAPLRAEACQVAFDVVRNYHFRQLSTSTPIWWVN